MLQKPHLQRKLAEIWYLDAVEDDEAVRFEDMFGFVVAPVWLLTRRLLSPNSRAVNSTFVYEYKLVDHVTTTTGKQRHRPN